MKKMYVKMSKINMFKMDVTVSYGRTDGLALIVENLRF